MARKLKNTSVASMSIEALFGLRDEVAEAISSRAAELRNQLEQLTGTKTRRRKPGVDGRKKPGLDGRLDGRNGGKVAPQFRSKKDNKQVWSGRGLTPRWMREEMKGTKLTKESFRIE